MWATPCCQDVKERLGSVNITWFTVAGFYHDITIFIQEGNLQFLFGIAHVMSGTEKPNKANSLV
jgi:hypothetical protein